MSSHEYRSRASSRAAAPSVRRRASSSRSATTAPASAAGSPGGTSTPASGVMTSLYPAMSDATAGEDDAVLAPVRVGHRRDQDAVRNDLVVAGKPAPLRLARLLRHRDPVVEAVGEEAPDGRRHPHPAEIPRGVEGGHHRRPRER